MNLQEAFTFWNPWWSGERNWFQAVDRELLPDLKELLVRKEVLTITGVRRCGKTTLLHLLIRSLLQEDVPDRNILHLNLEDPAFKGLSLFSLYEKYLEFMNPEGKLYLFLDEVQEIEEWQREVRKLYDGVREVKCVITGSNSSLLKGEYATLLTGRSFLAEVFPFSFREFVQGKGWGKGFDKHLLLAEKPRLMHLFGEYFNFGGFPEVVKSDSEKVKFLLLKEYYTSILTRDVLRRYPIRHSSRYEGAAHYLISNATSPFSPKNLAPTLNISQHTLEEYVGYLEDVYLFFTLKHFSYSVKQQLTYPRKVYSIDNGFINAVSFKFSEDLGKLLENLVMSELKRRGKECYYWKGKKECDFILIERGSVTMAIQVTYSLADPVTRKREIEGLLEAIDEFKLEKGLIFTYEEFETVSVNGKTIEVIPAWYWLLRENTG